MIPALPALHFYLHWLLSHIPTIWWQVMHLPPPWLP